MRLRLRRAERCALLFPLLLTLCGCGGTTESTVVLPAPGGEAATPGPAGGGEGHAGEGVESSPTGCSRSDQRLDTARPAGDADASGVRVCCDGSRVLVVWSEDAGSGGEVHLQRSADGGATWLDTPVRIDRRRVAGSSRNPEICCAGDNVYVVFEDDRDGPIDVRFIRSDDGGASWPDEDTRINTDGSGFGDALHPRISCHEENVFVAWHEARSGTGRDIHFNRSSDGGAKWLENDVRLNTNGAAASDSANPLIACVGLDVVVAWEDDRAGLPETYARGSRDGGQTWHLFDVRVQRSAASSTLQNLMAGSATVYALWEEKRAGGTDILIARTTTVAASWFAPLRANDRVGHASQPHSAVSGADVYVAWADDRDGEPDVYVRRSADGGVSFRGSERVNRSDAGATTCLRPRVRIRGPGEVCVLWEESRTGPLGLYLNRTSDGGTTWDGFDARADHDQSNVDPFFGAPTQRLLPRTCLVDGATVAVWVDDRTFFRDVYVNRCACE